MYIICMIPFQRTFPSILKILRNLLRIYWKESQINSQMGKTWIFYKELESKNSPWRGKKN